MAPSSWGSSVHSFFLWVSQILAPCSSRLTLINIQVETHKSVSMWTPLSRGSFLAARTLTGAFAPWSRHAHKHRVGWNHVLPHQRHIRCLQSVCLPLWLLITFQCPGSCCTDQPSYTRHSCAKPLGNWRDNSDDNKAELLVGIRKKTNDTDWKEKIRSFNSQIWNDGNLLSSPIYWTWGICEEI